MNIFDKILYINLEHREDRRAQAEIEFEKQGIIAERIEAIKGNPDNLSTSLLPGDVGCILSNIKCLSLAKENNWGTVLIFEDDVEFRPFASVLFKEWWKGVPEDWDMVYLGGNHFGCDSRLKNAPRIVPVTKHIYRTYHTLACHAFVIKNTMYDHMIENLNKLENTNDMVYAQAQTKFNVYIFKPNLAWQRAGFSDINNIDCNYDFMKD